MKILNILKLVICGTGMLWSAASYGQRIRNIPLGALPMQYNSSFAGESDGARLNTAFSYNIGGIGFPFYKSLDFGYHASYDQFVPALRSGVGVAVNRITQSYTTYQSQGIGRNDADEILRFYANSISLAIAPKFSLKGKYTLSPSVDLSFGRGKSEVDLPGNHPVNYHPNGYRNWLSGRLGLLFNTQKYYIGYSAYILNQVHLERHGTIKEGFRSYLQAGYTFQRSAESKFSFTPQLAFLLGGHKPLHRPLRLDFLEAINFTFRYEKYIAGFNNTGIHLGLQTEKLRVMLSTGGARGDEKFYGLGNLSCRYVFKS